MKSTGGHAQEPQQHVTDLAFLHAPLNAVASRSFTSTIRSYENPSPSLNGDGSERFPSLGSTIIGCARVSPRSVGLFSSLAVVNSPFQNCRGWGHASRTTMEAISSESIMRKRAIFLFAGLLIASGAALGKLPRPRGGTGRRGGEESRGAGTARKGEGLLEKGQDRVAARYRGQHPAGQAGAGRTPDHNMPKTTSERPGGTGPDPVRPQSAEAHSAPAK
jgi:hypothetical protein